MVSLKGHWGSRTDEDFLFQVASDFVTQLEEIMASKPMDRSELARRLNISKGRVSQILNDPGNLTLKNVVRYARALGRKVAVVAYDDANSPNKSGPIPPQVFVACWEKAGEPSDMFSASIVTSTSTETSVGSRWGRIQPPASNEPVNERINGTNYMIQKEQWDARIYPADI